MSGSNREAVQLRSPGSPARRRTLGAGSIHARYAVGVAHNEWRVRAAFVKPRWGFEMWVTQFTQGSRRSAATLGFRMERRWRSEVLSGGKI